MTRLTPRLRMFAGPNGSGKTTVQRDLTRVYGKNFLGVLVNPDDLEAQIRRRGRLSLRRFGLTASEDEVRDAFTSSSFLAQHQLAEAAGVLQCDGRVIDFRGLAFNSYYASVLADFLRRKLLAAASSFTFETVMSEAGKVELLRQARAAGYRTYLYYVATEDVAINVARVQLRVTEGGHDVPADKIVARYQRSLDLLYEAVRQTDRAYFFDTSEERPQLIAESTGGQRPVRYPGRIPNWFNSSVWAKFKRGARGR